MKKWLLILIPIMFMGCSNGENSVFAGIQTYWSDVDRAGTKNSRQYVHSNISMLYAQYDEYMRLDLAVETAPNVESANTVRSQQLYLLSRMRRVANEVPENELPREIKNIIY